MSTELRIQDSQPAVENIDAPNLTTAETADLERAINAVRAGELEFYVELTNRKQTNSKKRLPGEHYEPNRALAPHAHRGWLVAAPLNQKGEIYIHLYDEARAKSKGDKYGHTRATLPGLRSFTIMLDPRNGEEITRPGPLALPAEVEPEVAPVASNPAVAQGHAMIATGQAMIAWGQAMIAQAQAQ